MTRARGDIRRNLDWVTIGLYAFLSVLGWMAIYSASYDVDHARIFDMEAEHAKQLIWMGVCGLLAVVILNIEGEFFIRTSPIAYMLSILLLIAVLLVGKKIGGARSWFGVGAFSIQPSEFAKTATALLLAWFVTRTGVRFNALSTRLIAGAIIAIPATLIMIQPDAGTVLVFLGFLLALYREGLSGNILLAGFGAVVLAVVAILSGASTIDYPWYGEQSGIWLMLLVLTFLGLLLWLLIRSFVVPRKRKKSYIVLVIGLVGSLIFSYATFVGIEQVLKPHQKERIYVLFGMEVSNPDADYNIRHAKAAIGSGGWLGKGYLNGPMTRYD
ncbi:MAG: hypothetical protein RL226_1840, partial [Bacteroidota bacterium]